MFKIKIKVMLEVIVLVPAFVTVFGVFYLLIKEYSTTKVRN